MDNWETHDGMDAIARICPEGFLQKPSPRIFDSRQQSSALLGHRARFAIAVIRMAGRFPGTKNVDKFWQNLRDGVESISLIGEQEEIEL
ncbi:beta-ketoacyl synthase N-terminal-like domain-containing protein [Scytonema sp. PRP1]